LGHHTFCFGDFFLFLGWIDVLTRFIPSLKATFRELDALFDQMVEERKTVKTEDEEPNRKDLVDILLKLQKKGMLDVELTQANLKAILLLSLSLIQ
jgi:cytochrome P450